MTEALSLTELVERARDAGDDETVRVGDIAEALGPRSAAALMLLPALLTVSPLSGIPLFSSCAGLIIALIAAQLLIGRKTIWMPAFLRRVSIPRPRYEKAMGLVGRAASRVDRIFKQRLSVLTRGPFATVLVLACLLIALVMPLLEVIPTSSSIAATIISLFSLSLVTRDGIAATLGVAVILAAGYAAMRWLI